MKTLHTTLLLLLLPALLAAQVTWPALSEDHWREMTTADLRDLLDNESFAVDTRSALLSATALMSAALYNERSGLHRLLLQRGATVDQSNQVGETALMWAADGNTNPAVLVVLLEAGAEVNRRNDYGETPLMYAARYNSNPEILELLLQYGADPTAVSDAGYSVLDYLELNPHLREYRPQWVVDLERGMPRRDGERERPEWSPLLRGTAD